MQKAHNKEKEKAQGKRSQTKNSIKATIMVEKLKDTENETSNDVQSSCGLLEDATPSKHKRRGTEGGQVSTGPLYALEKRSK